MSKNDQFPPGLLCLVCEQFTHRTRKHCREYGFCYEILETFLQKELNHSYYMFGSSIEFTGIQGSDIDVVDCLNYITVITRLEDVPTVCGYVVMMIDCLDSPGYVKLQYVKNGKPLTEGCLEGQKALAHDYFSVDCDRRVVLCNLVDESGISSEDKLPKHGPAVRTNDLKVLNNSPPTDFVVAVRYKSWPSIANEWISRKREYNWPSQSVIERFKTLGCFMVKIGSPGSAETNVEWRISFSLQERELMFGLNNVQDYCYLILKRIKNVYLKIDKNESISSYHCKTCLFYMIESNPLSIWVPQNLTNCVLGCLEILQEWVLKRNCPNYFIANENMFARIQNASVWQTVTETLEALINKDIPLKVKFESYQTGETFKNPYGLLLLEQIYDCQLLQIFMVLSHSVKILRHILDLDNKPSEFVYHTKRFIFETILRLEKQLHQLQNTTIVTEHTAEECKTAFYLLVPFIHTSIGSHLAAYSVQCKNKAEEKSFETLAREHLALGVASDLTSGRLKKITYMHILGEYNTCLEELVYLENLYKGNGINVLDTTLFENARPYNYNVLSALEKDEYTTMNFAQSFCCAFVYFAPTEIELMPFALQIELFKIFVSERKSEFFCECIIIDSEIYLYFLLFLISKKMNKPQKERLSWIQKMKNVLPNIFNVTRAFCLMAWAFAEEGFIMEAMMYLCLSWQYQPKEKDHMLHKIILKTNYFNRSVYGQSVIWHMLILLRRIWFANFISFIETEYKLSLCFKCLKQENISTKKCSRCKTARYCTKDCQKEDRKVHRQICKRLVQKS